jgi:outer membrane lipoprotein-sorting protein
VKKSLQLIAMATVLVLWAIPSLAQTADEIIEKHLAATGGRAALSKITSRASSGTIALTTPVGELKGTIEVYNKKPNKSRTLIKIDAAAIGGGQIINDQRFDGTTGYVIDTFNGNREISGDQLQAMKSGGFPTPLLTYKEMGTTAVLANKERVGASDAYVIQFTPKLGPGIRVFIDSQSFMVVKSVVTINVPQLGGAIDQTVEFSDFREVDGFKIPFMTKSSNPAQTVTAILTDVKHNIEIDDSSFSKPAGQ